MILDSLSNNFNVFHTSCICYLPSQVMFDRPAIMKFILGGGGAKTRWERSERMAIVAIYLLAILQKSLDRALFLYIFIHEVRLSRAAISIVHIRKFYKM